MNEEVHAFKTYGGRPVRAHVFVDEQSGILTLEITDDAGGETRAEVMVSTLAELNDVEDVFTRAFEQARPLLAQRP